MPNSGKVTLIFSRTRLSCERTVANVSPSSNPFTFSVSMLICAVAICEFSTLTMYFPFPPETRSLSVCLFSDNSSTFFFSYPDVRILLFPVFAGKAANNRESNAQCGYSILAHKFVNSLIVSLFLKILHTQLIIQDFPLSPFSFIDMDFQLKIFVVSFESGEFQRIVCRLNRLSIEFIRDFRIRIRQFVVVELEKTSFACSIGFDSTQIGDTVF